MITNYHIFRLDRDRHGGGVLVYINSSFSAKIIWAGSNDLELIVISVSCKHLLHCLVVFYRPPSSAVDMFDILCSASGCLDSIYFYRFVLVGDFNVNYFFTNSFLYRQLELCLLPLNLTQIVTSATHNNYPKWS